MRSSRRSPSERRALARAALDSPDQARSSDVLLRVRCPHSHHVAMVYDTPEGAVYVSVLGPHAHGRRDFVDLAHHGPSPGEAHVDLVESPDPGDLNLPARCECGPRVVPRADIINALTAHRRTLDLE